MATIAGGEKLQAALNKIAAELKSAHSVEVGFFEDSKYPDGTLVAAVAAYQEFGTGNIPPRPFMRNAIVKNSNKWPVNLLTALKNTNYDAETSLGLLGQEIQEEIQDSILSNLPPPNKASTLKAKAKKHSNPQTLLDTGRLSTSARHIVK